MKSRWIEFGNCCVLFLNLAMFNLMIQSIGRTNPSPALWLINLSWKKLPEGWHWGRMIYRKFCCLRRKSFWRSSPSAPITKINAMQMWILFPKQSTTLYSSFCCIKFRNLWGPPQTEIINRLTSLIFLVLRTLRWTASSNSVSTLPIKSSSNSIISMFSKDKWEYFRRMDSRSNFVRSNLRPMTALSRSFPVGFPSFQSLMTSQCHNSLRMQTLFKVLRTYSPSLII